MEQSFLAWLKGRTRSLPQVALGIGDDAAVVELPTHSRLVATTDTIIDRVDFLFGQHAAADIGYKAMAVNLSDIAAMGGRPLAALVNLALPTETPSQTGAQVYEGIIEAAERFSVPIAGGDLSVYDGPLSISITLLGSIPASPPPQQAGGQSNDAAPAVVAPSKPWRRSGAEPGDCLVVSGPLGGSLLGRHLRPTPRLDLVDALDDVNIHAAIDISDGFSLDLDRMCAASGVGAEVDTGALPIHPDALARAQQTQRSPLQHALGDGEDFELILAIPPDQWQTIRQHRGNLGLTQVGGFTGRTGLWSRTQGGLRRMLASGYIHGQRRDAAAPEAPR